MHLHQNVKVTEVLGAVAAGTTVQNGTTLDMSGFEGVMFIASMGAITAGAVTSLIASGGAASNGSDKVAITGASVTIADDGDDKAYVLDIFRPLDRYITATVNRATQNAVINSVMAIQYGAKERPIVHDATSVGGSAIVVGGA